MSEVKVNKITPTTNCGTVTLGDSGDTLSIPCGATLSNAGSITNSGTITNTGTISGGTITGTIDNQVNWDTTKKTADFTAVSGVGYFVDTTSAAITVTLPASPSAGDLVGIKDYANTADTNNITIARNGSNIQGTANNFVIDTEGRSILLIYVDGTQGWLSTGASQASDISEAPVFTAATGGCVTTCGDFKIHTFTGPGTFTVTQVGNAPTVPTGGPNTTDYLVMAGGGGGGNSNGGGGGAGGYRASGHGPAPLQGTATTITVQAYPITVGAGGASGFDNPGTGFGGDGNNSIYSTITSAGGGGGAPYQFAGGGVGRPGGSGGGGGASDSGGPNFGGSGNTPPVSPPQGNGGGGAGRPPVPEYGGGGGGGAGAGGSPSAPGNTGGNGGAGVPNDITGTATTRGGGGGGNGVANGSGGSGGGGNATDSPSPAACGAANTGGGGGSSRGAGGSGVVIIRYKFQ